MSDERKLQKKEIKRGLLWALLYMFATLILPSVLGSELKVIPPYAIVILASLAITVLGVASSSRDLPEGWLTHVENPMTVKDFLVILGFFAVAKLIGLALSMGFAALTMSGISDSAMNSLVPGTESSAAKFFSVLDLALVCPICEETIYRGLVGKRFKKYGTVFAMVMSSFYFAIYHANPLQLISAFLPGMLFFYVATHYSLKWSILIHMLNNGLMGEFISPMLSKSAVPFIADYGSYVIDAVLIIVAALLLKSNNPIPAFKEFCSGKPNSRGAYKDSILNIYFFLTVVLFLVFTAGMALFVLSQS